MIPLQLGIALEMVTKSYCNIIRWNSNSNIAQITVIEEVQNNSNRLDCI